MSAYRKFATVLLVGGMSVASSAAGAYSNGWNNWPEWTPMYWMDEFLDRIDRYNDIQEVRYAPLLSPRNRYNSARIPVTNYYARQMPVPARGWNMSATPQNASGKNIIRVNAWNPMNSMGGGNSWGPMNSMNPTQAWNPTNAWSPMNSMGGGNSWGPMNSMNPTQAWNPTNAWSPMNSMSGGNSWGPMNSMNPTQAWGGIPNINRYAGRNPWAWNGGRMAYNRYGNRPRQWAGGWTPNQSWGWPNAGVPVANWNPWGWNAGRRYAYPGVNRGYYGYGYPGGNYYANRSPWGYGWNRPAPRSMYGWGATYRYPTNNYYAGRSGNYPYRVARAPAGNRWAWNRNPSSGGNYRSPYTQPRVAGQSHGVTSLSQSPREPKPESALQTPEYRPDIPWNPKASGGSSAREGSMSGAIKKTGYVRPTPFVSRGWVPASTLSLPKPEQKPESKVYSFSVGS